MTVSPVRSPVVVLAEYALDPPPRSRMLVRGLLRRCPLCGEGGLFRRWLFMRERCPRCDLEFERIEGHWLGAIAINTVLSLMALLAVIVVGVVLTYPDPPVGPLMLASLITAAASPLVFHPVSRTLWTAIDLALRPIEPSEIS
jgi:uncharacterized protein (DUF983 family)